MSESPSSTALTLELLEIASQFPLQQTEHRVISIDEAGKDGWLTMPTPETCINENLIATSETKVKQATDGIQETRKCLACIMSEFIGDGLKSEVARIGGVSRVWLNDVLSAKKLPQRNKLISFLDSHRVQDSVQQQFLQALEEEAKARGTTSFTKLDLITSANGHDH